MGRITKTAVGKIVFWMRKYSFSKFVSRFVGEIMGIPLPTHCRIEHNLYVGAKPGWFGSLVLKASFFSKTICLLDDEECKKSNVFFDVIHLPLPEFVEIPNERLLSYIQQIGILRKDKQKLFIHCREGVGRAPSVAASLLISEGLSVSDALRVVLTGRAVSDINSLQLKSLYEFESRFKEN